MTVTLLTTIGGGRMPKQAAVKPQMEDKQEKPVKRGRGQPPRYTPESLEEKLTEYLEHCRKTGEPVLITSFSIYINVDRSTLYEYSTKDEYSHVIKRLEDEAEDFASRCLFNGKNPAGVIFYLKNKHGWTDKQEVVNTNVNMLIASPDGLDLDKLRGALGAFERLQTVSGDVGKLIEPVGVEVVDANNSDNNSE
jgi:hypothetical protein